MENHYKFKVSKGRIFFEVFKLLLFVIAIPFIIFNQDEIHLLLIYNTVIFLFELVVTALTLSYLFVTFYNGYIFLNFNPNAELEIFNDSRFLIYKNEVGNEKVEVKVNLEDIYFIKRNFCKTVFLYYDEIFYMENEKIKKIIVPISLVYKIEKRMSTSKRIKITEYYEYLYRNIPTT